ncbi:hypothetical protein BH10PSE19_BH10PSE19_11600 [soil metagenome]
MNKIKSLLLTPLLLCPLLSFAEECPDLTDALKRMEPVGNGQVMIGKRTFEFATDMKFYKGMLVTQLSWWGQEGEEGCRVGGKKYTVIPTLEGEACKYPVPQITTIPVYRDHCNYFLLNPAANLKGYIINKDIILKEKR